VSLAKQPERKQLHQEDEQQTRDDSEREVSRGHCDAMRSDAHSTRQLKSRRVPGALPMGVIFATSARW